PCICLPTTLSGSEMTPLYGVKVGNEKRTRIDPRARPKIVICDPELAVSLPQSEVVATGMNCLAHCVEALYPPRPTPMTSLLALQGVRTLVRALSDRQREPNELRHVEAGMYAGTIGGMLVALAGIGFHHKICHAIGGLSDVAHGDSNAVILPHILAFNAPAIPDVMAKLAEAFNSPSAAEGAVTLARTLGAPGNLRDLGVDQAMLPRIAAHAVKTTSYNPQPIDETVTLALLRRAWAGEPVTP
ncbi:MAG: maleylacetate reductase, partial [Steroidobacteraceae bacterium]